MGAPDFLRRPSRVIKVGWFSSLSVPAARRFFIWSGTSGGDPGATSPNAGEFVDGVAGENSSHGVLAHRGSFGKVEAGGSISSGADVATDGNGRAVTAGTGDTVVARALEGATSGDIFWIAFTGA